MGICDIGYGDGDGVDCLQFPGLGWQDVVWHDYGNEACMGSIGIQHTAGILRTAFGLLLHVNACGEAPWIELEERHQALQMVSRLMSVEREYTIGRFAGAYALLYRSTATYSAVREHDADQLVQGRLRSQSTV